MRRAPDGFDSVVALGQSEPEQTKNIQILLDGRSVVIPQGLPKPNPRLLGRKSEFTQSEYLVYKESQVRIRYIIKMKWG